MSAVTSTSVTIKSGRHSVKLKPGIMGTRLVAQMLRTHCSMEDEPLLQVATRSKLSPACVYALASGRTRYPRFDTVVRVLTACRYVVVARPD